MAGHSIKRNPNTVAALADDDKLAVHDTSANVEGAMTLQTLATHLATLSEATPLLTLTNTTAGDGDGARDCDIAFKGTQSGGEESRLAQIKAEHDGAADDEKGRLRLYTNDGNDGTAPTLRLTIDSAGLATFAGKISASAGGAILKVGSGAAVPSQATMEAAFGTAAAAGDGFVGVYTDTNANTENLAVSNGTNWWYILLTVGA